MNQTNHEESFQKEVYGLNTTVNNLNVLTPEELRPSSRQSNFKKQANNKSISVAQNPSASRMIQKKKRSAMYVTNDSAGSKGTTHSRNSRRAD